MTTKILVVDDKQVMRDSVGATLQRAGYTVIAAADGATALSHLSKHRPAAVVTDLKMPEMNGLELLDRLKQADDQLPVVLMTAYGTVGDAVQAMRTGAFDFIQKPFEGDQLVMTVRRAVEHRLLLKENEALKSRNATPEDVPNLVGRSPAMRSLGQQIQQIANSHGTVLIQGESGTGKEVVARTLHAHSPRRERVLLCLNCAALSHNLLESELFGHEKGAFTGADQLRKGRFELADGGTLFLDEISEIDPKLQAKLLRVLQEGQFERVGSSVSMNVDVRVIATTNRDLSRAVAAGTFRQDLYYRLNVLPLHLPPLRERLDDVSLLSDHFLTNVAMREGRQPKTFEPEAVELMQQYAWPGNVRELQNICERASVLSKTNRIPAGLIQPWLITSSLPTAPVAPQESPTALSIGEAVGSQALEPLGSPPLEAPSSSAPASPHTLVTTHVKPLEQLEREQIIAALGRFNGNRTHAAKALGIGVRTLGLKLKKWKEQNLVAQSL